MRGWVKLLCSVACSVLLVPICGFAPDLSQKIGADVIVTAAPIFSPLAALRGGEKAIASHHLNMCSIWDSEPWLNLICSAPTVW